MRAALLPGVFISVLLLFLAGPAAGQEFGGIGAAVVPIASGELVIIKVVDPSPAATAGLLPGDLIVQVDGRSLQGTEFSEIVARHLWGPPGSRVEVVIRRPGRQGEQTIDLTRIPMDPALGQTPGVQMITPPQERRQELEGR